jgi:hypothetical protein
MRRFAHIINEKAPSRAENRPTAQSRGPRTRGSGKNVVEIVRREYVNQVALILDGQYSFSGCGDI